MNIFSACDDTLPNKEERGNRRGNHLALCSHQKSPCTYLIYFINSFYERYGIFYTFKMLLKYSLPQCSLFNSAMKSYTSIIQCSRNCHNWGLLLVQEVICTALVTSRCFVILWVQTLIERWIHEVAICSGVKKIVCQFILHNPTSPVHYIRYFQSWYPPK